MPDHTNALIHETSPYLLQHAHNPVNWYPWGEVALAKARTENKLMLVSIGYSACHWCHVMERETFEDSAAASFMNEHFVCIKVDREERPDLDQIYMSAVQLMSGQGGWPLNCFTLPDGRPIYGGTYFKTDQWIEVLQSLSNLYATDSARVVEYAEKLTQGVQLAELVPPVEDEIDYSTELLQEKVMDWQRSWDLREGGPNRAPKFPLPDNYLFLLQYAALSGDDKALAFTELTLDKMAQGGIYDHVGGGFARYSVDAMWKVPHFEKMLYDNAQLIALYSDAYRAFKKPSYKRVVDQTTAWLEREMLHQSGLYFSALDADSEGEEGKYYVWTESELKAALGDDYAVISEQYHVGGMGHWEFGQNILLRRDDLEQFATAHQHESNAWVQKTENALGALLALRSQRVAPGTDTKCILSWNAQLATGFTKAYRAFNDPIYLHKAEALIERIEKVYTDPNSGNLFHTATDGKPRINAFLDDYAFLIDAYIELHQATFNEVYLHRALALTEKVNFKFGDRTSLMYWFTSIDDEELIARKQETMDNVIPASNSVMALNLHRLGVLFDRQDLKDKSEAMLRGIVSNWDYLQSYSRWAQLYCMHAWSLREVAIVGNEAQAFARALDQQYLPNIVLLGGIGGKLPLLEGKNAQETTIFVCENKTCQRPVTSPKDAIDQLIP